jgi:hypothetical protein
MNGGRKKRAMSGLNKYLGFDVVDVVDVDVVDDVVVVVTLLLTFAVAADVVVVVVDDDEEEVEGETTGIDDVVSATDVVDADENITCRGFLYLKKRAMNGGGFTVRVTDSFVAGFSTNKFEHAQSSINFPTRNTVLRE